MLIARRYVVSGLVQGVGFRYFAAEVARLEGISGWVRNRGDGAVEIFAEGDRESVVRFEGKLRRGPPLARVSALQVNDDVPAASGQGFVVRHDK